MNWYVIQVVTGKENIALKKIEQELKMNNLEKFVKQILIPKEQYYKVRNGKKVIAEKNYFPGYIMLEASMNGELYGTIRRTDNVVGFLGKKDEPEPLKPHEIKKFLKDVDELGEKDLSAEINYNIGEVVKIVNGPFNTFNGEIYNINEDKKKLQVNVYIFGRKTPVELDFEHVERN